MKLAVVLLLLTITTSVSAECNPICYVRPNNSNISLELCPDEPCLTVDLYTQQASRFFTSDATFIFLSGNHSFESTMNLTDVNNITLRGAGDVIIICKQQISINCENVSKLIIDGLTFVLHYQHTQTLASSVVIGNSEQVLISNSVFQGGSFTSNVWVTASDFVKIENCLFEGNSVDYGGAVNGWNSSITFFGNTFVRNRALQTGGAPVAFMGCTVDISHCSFENNTGSNSGGLQISSASHVNISTSRFVSNTGTSSLQVAAVSVYSRSTVAIQNCYFAGNVGFSGGALIADKSALVLNGNVFVGNVAAQGGAIYTFGSNITFEVCLGNLFAHNIATHGNGGAAFFVYSKIDMKKSSATETEECYQTYFANNIANGDGGAISFLSSFASLIGRNFTFTTNSAGRGGAICLRESTVSMSSAHLSFIRNKATKGGAVCGVSSSLMLGSKAASRHFFLNNVAGNSGGGVHFEGGSLRLFGFSHFEQNSANREGSGAVSALDSGWGGALSAINSNYELSGSITFTSNVANVGGAMYISASSTLTMKSHTNIIASHNYASRYGGVIYHEDAPSSYQCSIEKAQNKNLTVSSLTINNINSVLLPSCFISLKNLSDGSDHFPMIKSLNDSAGEGGSFLFGGLLDKCSIEAYFTNSEIARLVYVDMAYALLRDIVLNIEPPDSRTPVITSKPLKLCFCSGDGYKNCSVMTTLETVRGQTFTIAVIALGVLNTTMKTEVRAVTKSTGRLKLNQSLHTTYEVCTSLSFNMFSIEKNDELILYPSGPCRDTGLARAVVNVILLPCPDGFTQFSEQCVCEDRLQVYGAECVINDDVHIEKQASLHFWMDALYDNGSYQGLILYRSCPLQHCAEHAINITLNNTDVQCSMNRAGLLCGKCATNHSLLLGSTQCQVCSNVYLALLIPFAAAGIALVVFLSFLRLTVATGMINSIILYANIVQANKDIILPANPKNVLTVFIAWMNLDLGLETCFYNGMDAYAQTWHQFAFPLYVWILITLIILISRYSITMSKLIGHNPIAVLATLLLMSYTKILKIVIEVFASADLEYPNNKTVTVWLKDANVPYLKSKHLVLTLMTSLILVLLFLPYTILLLLGHKLYRFLGRKHIHWLIKLKPLLDSYYAPYKMHTRYWTGLLLILRCILYIIFSFNSLGGKAKSLFAIQVTMTIVVVVAWLSGQIYRSSYVTAIEASVYLNLIVLSTTTVTSSPPLVYSLLGIVFATMIGIIIYHFHLAFVVKSSVWLKTKTKCIEAMKKRKQKEPSGIFPLKSSSHDPHKVTTKSVLKLRESLLESN